MNNEVWKDIYFIENGIEYNYIGLYQVSNLGRVKSLGNGLTYNSKERILKLGKEKKGYYHVGLNKNGKKKYFKVHRLVAHMFVDGYFDGAEVDHINTITSDNRVKNLRWVTNKDNKHNQLTKKHYSKATKGKNNPMYGKLGNKHHNSIVVVQILNNTIINVWGSISDAERYYKTTHITECCKGNRNKVKGYKWKYLSDISDEEILDYIRHNMQIKLEVN